MKCPVCPDVTLLMTERQGIEIDYCPNCRGVWLDRGELDKLIQLSVGQAEAARPAPAPAAPPPAPAPRYAERDDYKHRDHHYSHKPYRKKSWLHEIFD